MIVDAGFRPPRRLKVILIHIILMQILALQRKIKDPNPDMFLLGSF